MKLLEQWILNQEPEDFPDMIEFGDGLTISDVQKELTSGVEIRGVYQLFDEGLQIPVIAAILSNGRNYYMEGSIADVYNEF